MLCKLLGHSLIYRSFVTKDYSTFIVSKCTRCGHTKTDVVSAPASSVTSTQLDKVRDFMRAAEQHIPERPCVPNADVAALRVKLIAEELLELAVASDVYFRYALEDGFEQCHTVPTASSIIDAADAFADLLYVVLGGAIAWGIDLNKVFDEVHAANMRKFDGGSKRADGKWQKPANWQPPDIRAVVWAQMD